MEKAEIIEKTEKFVKTKLYGEGSGHDWWHTWRVWQMAKRIGKKEKADLFIIELASLLHDIADWKFQDRHNDLINIMIAKKWLEGLKLDPKIISNVCQIIKTMTFKGALVKDRTKSIEAKVVQDADRLDAMGAMGIARTFAYGGFKGRQMYDPDIKPKMHKSFKEYKDNKSPSINHFYEKLLFLKSRINTKTGKQLAEHRHNFMKKYLKEFFQEWKGKK